MRLGVASICDGRPPALIVTCRTGHDSWCEEEIGDVLMPRDPSVRVLRTGFPGVLAVCTRLDPRAAYEAAYGREYGFLDGLVPVDAVLTDVSELGSWARSVASRLARVRLRVKGIGVRGLSQKAWKTAVTALREAGVAVDPRARDCLHVLIFSDGIVVGLAKCRPPFKPGVLKQEGESYGAGRGRRGRLEDP